MAVYVRAFRSRQPPLALANEWTLVWMRCIDSNGFIRRSHTMRANIIFRLGLNGDGIGQNDWCPRPSPTEQLTRNIVGRGFNVERPALIDTYYSSVWWMCVETTSYIPYLMSSKWGGVATSFTFKLKPFTIRVNGTQRFAIYNYSFLGRYFWFMWKMEMKEPIHDYNESQF